MPSSHPSAVLPATGRSGRRRLVAALLCTGLAGGLATAGASPANATSPDAAAPSSAASNVGAHVAAAAKQRSSKPVLREVCRQAYVTRKAGAIFDGTVFKGNHILVRRTSPSGRYSYGYVYGHVNRNGWVETAALCKRSR